MSDLPMYGWGDRAELTWPEFPGWDLEPTAPPTALGDFGDVKYTDYKAYCFVYFHHDPSTTGGTAEMSAFGRVRKTEWRDERAIKGVLDVAADWSAVLIRKFRQDLEGMRVRDWELELDGTDLVATYRGPGTVHQKGEAYLSVSFMDCADTLLSGDVSTAHVSYAAGDDYGGSYGKREATFPCKRMEDIQPILRKAEALFEKWHTRQASSASSATPTFDQLYADADKIKVALRSAAEKLADLADKIEGLGSRPDQAIRLGGQAMKLSYKVFEIFRPMLRNGAGELDAVGRATFDAARQANELYGAVRHDMSKAYAAIDHALTSADPRAIAEAAHQNSMAVSFCKTVFNQYVAARG